MKKNNKFRRNNSPEKYIICSCRAKSKLKSHKNYPFGKKSKVIISKYYKCDKCGKIQFINENQKGGRK